MSPSRRIRYPDDPKGLNRTRWGPEEGVPGIMEEEALEALKALEALEALEALTGKRR